jgi:hypothetical protein
MSITGVVFEVVKFDPCRCDLCGCDLCGSDRMPETPGKSGTGAQWAEWDRKVDAWFGARNFKVGEKKRWALACLTAHLRNGGAVAETWPSGKGVTTWAVGAPPSRPWSAEYIAGHLLNRHNGFGTQLRFLGL